MDAQFQACRHSVEKDLTLSVGQCSKTDGNKEEMSNIPYASVVGSLTYATLSTRFDIFFVIGLASRYQSNLGPIHWQAIRESCTSFVVLLNWSFTIKVGTLNCKDTRKSIGVMTWMSLGQPQDMSSPLVGEPYHGVTRSKTAWLCWLWRHNMSLVGLRHKRLCGLGVFFRILISLLELMILSKYCATILLPFSFLLRIRNSIEKPNTSRCAIILCETP